MLLVLLSSVLAACAGARARPDARHLPDDFSLSVAVQPGGGREPAWYVIEPDGTLRAAIGARRPDSPRPAGVRTLTRDQVRGVWELACAAGLAGEHHGEGKVSTTLPGSPAGAAVVEVASAGKRRTVAAPAPSDASGAGLSKLLERLRELAWIEPAGT